MGSQKHNIEGYTEMFSMQLAGRIIILAEKPDAEDPYMVATCKWDNPLGVDEYYNVVVTNDYLEAAREFIKREAMQLNFVEAERSLFGLPVQTLTTADCIPNGMDSNLNGQIVVVKPEALAPEYRVSEHQLGICRGGNGSRPNARGNAVFCDNLYDGKSVRHERYQIAGVIDPDKMPEWAKAKLAELHEKENTAQNLACAAAIDESVQAAYKGDYHYDLETALQTLHEKFGADRVNLVLSTVVCGIINDGRISQKNKDWAQDFSVPQEQNGTQSLRVKTHPAVLNGLVTRAREASKLQEKKPSLLGNLETAKKTAHEAAAGKEKPQKSPDKER